MSNLLIEHLDELLHFLDEFLPLANSHVVDYFTNSLFSKHIKTKILEEIDAFGSKSASNILFDKDSNQNCPYLSNFIAKSKKFILYNHSVCLNKQTFLSELTKNSFKNFTDIKFEGFMKLKKAHEVEVFSAIVTVLQKIGGTSHVVDIGDGKGYVSSLLALHHQIPVLGVDASSTKTEGASERLQKLKKQWNAFIKHPNREMKGSSNLYKQVTQYVAEHTNIRKMVSECFCENNPKICLVGLHTCGNLGAISVKMFNDDTAVQTLCNISCCYHQITETEMKDNWFPLSKYLKQKQYRLGRNARMLAAQSLERILYKQEMPNKLNFYRAVLQVALHEYGFGFSDVQVGRMKKKKYNSFVEYANEAVSKLNISMNISNEQFEALYKCYENEEEKFNIFYLLRCYLAPAIESLILIDRLLYLYESNHNCAYLVKLFDPLVSPRCYALIAFKNREKVLDRNSLSLILK